MKRTLKVMAEVVFVIVICACAIVDGNVTVLIAVGVILVAFDTLFQHLSRIEGLLMRIADTGTDIQEPKP